MKISATLRNTRGGSKVTADDTRILVELRRGNTLIGTIGLYNVVSDKVEGYNVIWQKHDSTAPKTIEHFEKGKTLTDKCSWHTCTDKAHCGTHN